MGDNIRDIKCRIIRAIKDLERSDYIDICILIKSTTVDSSFVYETPRGSFIDVDKLEDATLIQLDHMITTKLQRISER